MLFVPLVHLRHATQNSELGTQRDRAKIVTVEPSMVLDTVLAKIFGTKNEREIKAIRPTIVAMNELEPQMQELSDADLAAKTVEFKQRLANGESLDDLLIESFAVCREAGKPALHQRHFYGQCTGGSLLQHAHRG